MKAEVIENESVSIATPKGQQLWKEEAKRALEDAQSLKVVDNESFLAIGELRDRWGAKAKAAFAMLNPGCQDADKHHSKLVQDRDECVKPFERAAATAKQSLINYRDEQDRIRRLEQARLDAADKKKREDEAIELAATLEAAGAGEAAAQILDEPIRPSPVILPPSTPKIQGFSSRRIYDAEITDQAAFWQGILEGQIPREAIGNGDEKWLKQQAGRLKQAMQWPGVKLVWRDV